MYLCLTTCYKFKGCSKKISLCFIDLFLWLKYFIDELVNGSFVLAKLKNGVPRSTEPFS